jgi:phosphatidylglycerol lysyltransferase
LREMRVHWAWLFTLGAADWLLAFAVFGCILRSGGIFVSPDTEARMFFIGQGIGLASLIPGGLGSADAFWLTWLVPFNGKGPAALVVYRLFYYFLPWAGATLLLVRRTVHSKVRWAGPSRIFVSSLVLVAGCLILASVATPGLAHRITVLRRILPVAVLETSHVATGIIGLFLLVLSRGLRKGYRAAYRTTLGFLLAGAVGSMLKGLDYEEAILLLLTAALLWTHSRLFTSPSRPGGTAISIMAPIALALFVYAGVGLTAFSGARMPGSLLVTLAHTGYAGRFLRTLSVLLLLALLVAIYLILRKPHHDAAPSDEDIRRALTVHEKFGRGTNALMVLNRDKCIHFLQDSGFCLYRTTGKYLVVFSDPIVAPGVERALLASLLDKAGQVDRSLVFYQISADWIPILHDFGYSFFKLGEEAIVDLGRFSIQGNKGKAMRNVLNRFRNDGYSFEVVPAAEVAGNMGDLRRVSDEWLNSKGSKEKQFSIGFFDERYLSSFPCALVRDGSRRMVAFANILTGPSKEELSVDLMRYIPECPNGVMDFLFLNLFDWGKQQGYGTFNLGMAPLATVGEVRQARLQERLANIVFQHGEHWYNFRGLRQFKDKYGPTWVPRYLAYPAFWMWAQAIISIAALIAGGWRSVAFPEVRPASSPKIEATR